ncbi:MAG: BMC domain-containing protein, partial [Clostridiales bacterium]|nr:BMC domain-containing protein [Clostridiales bacterium]
MSKAIGAIELNSIARGIEVSDYMLKASKVDLVRSSTLCPGKYMVIISGDTGDVRASIAEGDKRGAECVLDTLIIPNVHPQLVPAISLTNRVEARGAVGIMEFFSVTAALRAADVAAKAANVTLIEIRIGYAIGGKGYVTLTGDVGS